MSPSLCNVCFQAGSRQCESALPKSGIQNKAAKEKRTTEICVFLVVFSGLHGCPLGNRPVKATAYDHDLAIKETLGNKACSKNPSTQKNFFDIINCHQKYRQEGYGYGSIPINTIFSGMNIHLPATSILMFTRGTRF